MSTILVNTLTGTSTAGSIAVTGEGGSTTTNLQQGLAKFWVRWESIGTAAIEDSFGYSSLTDEATGSQTLTTTSAMANINSAHSGMAGYNTTNQFIVTQNRNSHTPTTTAARYETPYANSTLGDVYFAAVVLHGDLA